MKKLISLAFVSITLFNSCEEDINIDVKAGDKKIVIEGNIENGKPAEVIVTRNSPLFSTINFADILVTDAKVYVSNGVITDTLKLDTSLTTSAPILYTGNTVIGVPGQTYYLTVIAEMYLL